MSDPPPLATNPIQTTITQLHTAMGLTVRGPARSRGVYPAPINLSLISHCANPLFAPAWNPPRRCEGLWGIKSRISAAENRFCWSKWLSSASRNLRDKLHLEEENPSTLTSLPDAKNLVTSKKVNCRGGDRDSSQHVHTHTHNVRACNLLLPTNFPVEALEEKNTFMIVEMKQASYGMLRESWFDWWKKKLCCCHVYPDGCNLIDRNEPWPFSQSRHIVFKRI